MYDDYYYYEDDTATKWYSLASECYIINKEQDSISLVYPYLSLSNLENNSINNLNKIWLRSTLELI